MKRNLLLLFFFLVSVLLVVNSTKRLLIFKTTAQKVEESELRLQKLKEENESLKRDFEYKKSQEFAEGEIRNKLGLAQEGEAVVVLPKNDSKESKVESGKSVETPNYIKWWNLFFGG